MKTKTLIMVCLLLGIGLSHLSAQNSNSEGTRSIAWNWTGGWYTYVYCNGDVIDLIIGEGTARVVDHYKNYEIQFELFHWSGTGTSVMTGENFTFSEMNKYWVPKEGEYTCSTHVKGDKGALHNLYFRWDDTGIEVVQQAVCTGNSK